MDGNVVVWIIIGLLFAVGSIIKRAMAAAAEKERQGQQGGRPFSAPPDQVREFLEEMRRGRQPAQPREGEEVAAPVQEPLAMPVEVVEDAVPVRAPEPLPTPVPQARPPRAKKRKKVKAERAVPAPAQPPAAPAKARVPAAFRLPGTDLKKAIVWSEVIGRPVSMRKRIGYRPPRLGQ